MQGQEGTHNLVFLENDVVEATFPDDKSDIEDEPDQQYEVNYWRKEEDIPTGFTFKSKKKIFPGSSGSCPLPFPYCFLLKAIRKCLLGASDPASSLFLTFSY